MDIKIFKRLSNFARGKRQFGNLIFFGQCLDGQLSKYVFSISLFLCTGNPCDKDFNHALNYLKPYSGTAHG